MELVKPKDRLSNPIKGTEKRDLPRFISRSELTWFVRYMSESGAIPLSNIPQFMVSFGGDKLNPQQRKVFFKHAQIWQDLLLRNN